MDVYEAIQTRRDIERFAEACPPREMVQRLIEAAVWAPNHRLTQPWRFHVLAGEGRVRMGDAVTAWLAEHGGTEAQQQAARSKLLRSPVTIAVSQLTSPGDPERDLEDYAACACAIENLLLAATAEGLVAHLSTGALTTYEGAKRYLGIAPSDRIVAYINLGYARPDAPPSESRRDEPVIGWHWD